MLPPSTAAPALARTETRYREIFERSPAGNFITTADGMIVACNTSFARLLGFTTPEQAMAINAHGLYHNQQERQQFLDVIAAAGHVEGYETTLMKADGSSVPVLEYAVGQFDESGALVEIDGYLIDLTNQKRAESALYESMAQLRQGQRMEAMGRLAGGISHDFNNLLTAILGFSDLLLSEGSLDARARADVEQIHRSGTSAASLTRQLLAFSRKQVLKPATLDLNQVVTEVAVMLDRLLGEDVTLRTTLAAEPAYVSADRGQLEQVLMNLAVNARDAMPKGGPLDILIKAEAAQVVLEVRDSGTGMDPELLPQIFEPFFTTKPAGEGTGLGLATVYGIVAQSGGSIEVDSETGRGTVFSVRLPRLRSVPAPVAAAPAAAPVERGHETVLVVDDQAAVRSLVRAVLERLGYTVVMAEAGDAAVAIIERRVPAIDLVLCDVVMPGMSGPEILATLTALQPTLRLLLMSGFSPSSGRLAPNIPAHVRMLHKPFLPAALAALVRNALDAPAARAPAA